MLPNAPKVPTNSYFQAPESVAKPVCDITFGDIPAAYGFSDLLNLSSITIIPKLANIDAINPSQIQAFVRNRETNNAFEKVNAFL
jgi:hypothetical protein